MSALSPLPAPETISLLIFFSAIHDIGKFSLPFQWLVPDLAQTAGLPEWDRPTRGDKYRHTFLAQSVWTPLRKLVASGCGVVNDSFFLPLEAAAFGHHGEPIDSCPAPPIGFDNGLKDAARSFVEEAAALFLHGGLPDFAPLALALDQAQAADLDEESLRPLSWLAAGLYVLADWIGSNGTWFPPRPQTDDLAAYWPCARKQADKALAQAGILSTAPSVATDFHTLLPHLDPTHSPHPMQQAVLDLPAPGGPELLILEDVTGGGKTEAAILAAHRTMRAGLASGLFVGLPTMATANAMYSRLAASYRTLFLDPEASLVLAHGSRTLHDDYLRTIALESPNTTARDAQDAEAVCAAWIADNRKKSLLAPCGAGTLDQALLATLPSRHQSLRLLGLSRSVLIADEVHAYDEYTGRLLEILLTFHAALGGSAILLTATMPMALRERLVAAWREGRALAHAIHDATERETEDTPAANTAFPLLTRVTDDDLIELPVAAARGLDVAVECVHDEAAMFQALANAHRDGACACWVRNTVADAMDARQRLVGDYSLPAESVNLFHARFAGCDRRDIEARVMQLFGKESQTRERAGNILIATQVVEQSLDLDFDLLLTDLAPMELLIQRAGRCHRHARGTDQELRPQGYRTGRMLVLGPPPQPDAGPDWYADMFDTGQYVYPRHGMLWLTARLLADKGRLRLPEDARELVEGAYANDAPQALQEVDDRVLGERYGERAMADLAGLYFPHGYCKGSGMQWDKDMKTPTRLGEATQQMRLVRCDETGARLWAAKTPDDVSMRSCLESEVRLSMRRLSTPEAPPEWEKSLDALREAMPDQGRWCLLLPLTPDGQGGWTGHGQDDKGTEVEVEYGALGFKLGPT